IFRTRSRSGGKKRKTTIITRLVKAKFTVSNFSLRKVECLKRPESLRLTGQGLGSSSVMANVNREASWAN
ncbi:hypothetical protein CpipJ_CPIJ009903, partial [Culex quinquefasciatus]